MLHGVKHEWFEKPHGIMITINYVLVVPLLLGIYICMIQEVLDFFQSKKLTDWGLEWKKWMKCVLVRRKMCICVMRSLLFIIALIITWSGMQAATGFTGENTNCYEVPWVIQNSGCELNYVGVLYYTLRGISGYLALGLILSALGLCIGLYCGLKYDPCQLFITRSARINLLILPIRRCVIVGPTVFSLHGFALMLQWGELHSSKQYLKSILVNSTWIYWIMVSLIATGCLIFIMRWFRDRLDDAIMELTQKIYQEAEELQGRKK